MAIENEQFEMIMMEVMEKTEKTVSVLNAEYITIRAGRANPHILDKVLVDYYGSPTPINQVGNLSVTEGRCLVIAPWDASMLKVIEKQLLAENRMNIIDIAMLLGFANPSTYSKHFLKEFGISPSEYRRRKIQNQ